MCQFWQREIMTSSSRVCHLVLYKAWWFKPEILSRNLSSAVVLVDILNLALYPDPFKTSVDPNRQLIWIHSVLHTARAYIYMPYLTL